MQNGIAVEERDYFKEPFTEAELRALIDESGDAGVSGLFASRSPSLKKMGLVAADLPDERKIELMLEEPRFVRRPIIRLGDRLLIGANLKAVTAALAAWPNSPADNHHPSRGHLSDYENLLRR